MENSGFEREYYDKWSREDRAEASVEAEVKSFVSVINEMLKQGFDWDKIRSIAKVPDTALPEILKIFPEYAKA